MVEIAKKYRAKFGFEMILLAYGLTVLSLLSLSLSCMKDH